MPVEPLKSKAAGGNDVLYSQVAPCTHVWWDDNPELELFDWTRR
jgi:hypothetical protein